MCLITYCYADFLLNQLDTKFSTSTTCDIHDRKQLSKLLRVNYGKEAKKTKFAFLVMQEG